MKKIMPLSLIFFLAFLESFAKRPADFSSSATEKCSHSPESVHTVSEREWQKLLARLEGDTEPSTRPKRKKRPRGRGRGGQR